MRVDERSEEAPEAGDLRHSVLQLQQQIELAIAESSSEREAGTSEATSELEIWVSRTESVVMAAGFGLVAALLRGGSLIAMAASSVPVWKGLDPVAALLVSDSRRDQRAAEIAFAERIEDETDDVGRILDDERS